MYAFVRGPLVEASPQSATVEAGGLGYEILIPASLFTNLPACGEDVKIWTSFIIRENSQALYGFASKSDKELFEVLVGISGIGPKTALGIIGNLSPSELQQAVRNKDVKAMCKIPGIGKKTAERLLIEIRDKLPALIQREMEDQFGAEPSDPQAALVADAVSALINLGFSRGQAQTAVKQTMESTGEPEDLSALITTALQKLQ